MAGKPHINHPGYVTERKHPLGGHLTLYDRRAGADWIDADGRFVLMRYLSDGRSIGLVEFENEDDARAVLRAECIEQRFDVDWGGTPAAIEVGA